MNEPNWDEIAEQAERTPRVLLADLLADADRIKAIVVSYELDDHELKVAYTWEEGFPASSVHMIGMLETAKHHILEQQTEND